MKILQVITRSEVGGSQAVVADLTIGLAERGHDVMVASGPEGAAAAWAGLPAGIRVVQLDSLIREVRPAQDVRATRELGRLYRSWQPDIVHLHTSKAAAVGRLARGIRKERIVYTMHGFGQLQLANPRLLAVDRALRSRCGAVVAVSEADARAMREAGYRPRLIRNGCPDMSLPRPLDSRTAASLQAARAERLPLFLMAAREAPPKRVDLARQAATGLAGHATVLWAGGDPQPSDPGNFIALGVVDVRALLTRVDGFLLLSDHEGLPMSLLEALSAALPCVASAIPGCLEVLGQTAMGTGPVGIAVSNSAGDVVSALTKMAEERELRRSLGTEARRRWSRLYSVDQMVSGYEDLYRELQQKTGG